MRQLTETFAGQEFTFVANFATSVEIAKQVADPMKIARDITEQSFAPGQQKAGSFNFTIDNVAKLLHIGAKAGGHKTTLAEMNELVFEHGFFNSQAIATDYLTLIVGPQPEETLDEVEKEQDEPEKP